MPTEKQHTTRWWSVLSAAALIGGCAEQPTAATGSIGSTVAIDIAALHLQGVGDVIWDVEVDNGASPPQVVWQRRLASSSYGDDAGSVSYVGPCDADPDASENTVRVWVVGVYALPVTSVGTFAAGAAGGVTDTPLPFQNPTATAALEQEVHCQPNADVSIRFDVALMRPAQQGFFDIAVSFNDIFCAAKFDCCTETEDGTGCASDIELLFDASGDRAPTMVLGFACTAGPDPDVATNLYLDALQLDCTDPTVPPFAANVTLNPSGPVGNQCSPGPNGMSACTGVVTESGVDADTYLFQLGLYRGEEGLTSGGANARKVYWNVALGVKRPAIASCWLRTRGTADNANGTPLVTNGSVAGGAVYPYLQWDVNLATCKAEPLTLGGAGGMVRAEYTATDDDATGFAYGYGPSLTSGPFCADPCENGGQCVSGACACATGFSGATCADTDCLAWPGNDADTTFLLHADGGLLDAAGTPHAVTVNSTVVDATTAVFGGGSASFNGSTFLSLASSPDWSFGAGDFTIDGWFKRTRSGLVESLFGQNHGTTGANLAFDTYFYANDTLNMRVSPDGSGSTVAVTTTATYTDAAWHHFALVRNGTSLVLYVDGVSAASATLPGGFAVFSSPEPLAIGSRNTGTGNPYPFSGHLDELRISKGIARWTADFTPPSTPAVADANTSLLLHMDPPFVDSAALRHPITRNGAATTSTSAQFGPASASFPGSASLSVPGADFDPGAGSFTVDLWFNTTASGVQGALLNKGYTTFGSCWADDGYILFINTDNKLHARTEFAALNTSVEVSSLGAVNDGLWHHAALVRNAGVDLALYLDGVRQESSTAHSSQPLANTRALEVGGGRNPCNGTATALFTGQLDEVRVSQVARWTASFTPPCGPYLGAVGNDAFTKLLLHLDGADGAATFDDSSASGHPQPTPTGTPALSAATPRLGTASAAFNGASGLDFPASPDWSFGTPTAPGGSGDFTIDFWLYANTWTPQTTLVGHGGDVAPWSTLGLWFGMYNGDTVIFQVGNDNSNYVQIISSALANPTGAWHHIAATRFGTTYTLWVDGVANGTPLVLGTVDASNAATLRLGHGTQGGTPFYLNGYLDEVRVSKGVARWTAAFTPPAAPYGSSW